MSRQRVHPRQRLVAHHVRGDVQEGRCAHWRRPLRSAEQGNQEHELRAHALGASHKHVAEEALREGRQRGWASGGLHAGPLYRAGATRSVGGAPPGGGHSINRSLQLLPIRGHGARLGQARLHPLRERLQVRRAWIALRGFGAAHRNLRGLERGQLRFQLRLNPRTHRCAEQSHLGVHHRLEQRRSARVLADGLGDDRLGQACLHHRPRLVGAGTRLRTRDLCLELVQLRQARLKRVVGSHGGCFG